jgi:hypothetical protein
MLPSHVPSAIIYPQLVLRGVELAITRQSGPEPFPRFDNDAVLTQLW